jgi:putative hydrolase of the HAD superfamily
LLEDLQLTPCFEAVIISIQTGEAKPSTGIFQRCADALRLPAAAILHVGDRPAEDFFGARSAGMEALRIDRRRRLPGENTLAQLGELLSRFPTGADAADKGG